MNIAKILVGDLQATFKSLPLIKGSTFKSNLFVQLRSQLRLCNEVIKNVHNQISEVMLSLMEEEFLENTVGPSFLQPDEECARSASIYLRECLLLMDAPALQRALVLFLLGDFDEPETPDDQLIHLIRSKLINRMVSPHQGLCIATLKLIESLINLFDRELMYNLLFRTLIPRYHLKPEYKPSDLESLQSTIGNFLTFLPEASLGLSSGYEAYLLDVQEQIRLSTKMCSNWPVDPQNSMHDQFHIAPLVSPEDLTREEALERWNGGGLFMQSLLGKIRLMMTNSFDVNLVVTGIVARLAQYPFPLLYLFLLDKKLDVVEGVDTLWSVLSELSKEISSKASQIPAFREKLGVMRNEVAGASTASVFQWTEEETKLLQGVIVLEEFVKELAATLAVWAH